MGSFPDGGVRSVLSRVPTDAEAAPRTSAESARRASLRRNVERSACAVARRGAGCRQRRTPHEMRSARRGETVGPRRTRSAGSGGGLREVRRPGRSKRDPSFGTRDADRSSGDRTRTCDPGLMNPLLYQLSYAAESCASSQDGAPQRGGGCTSGRPAPSSNERSPTRAHRARRRHATSRRAPSERFTLEPRSGRRIRRGRA